MTVTLLRGNARHLTLEDASVDLIVTSPPFWALRSYTDGGEHYDGQIGAEPTPAAYVDNLIECTREWMRVLKPTGSMWVNLGDKYKSNPVRREGQDAATSRGPRTNLAGGADIPAKSLHGLPWRYAIRCIDELGLILRAEVIWSKPNGLPESTTDRVRRSHEQWFHFTLRPRYFAAIDAIREPHVYPADDRSKRPSGYLREMTGHMNGGPNPLGKLPGSVWTIASQPLKVPAELGIDHFAAFPMEWPKRIIQGWSPSGICTACGEGRRVVATRSAAGAVSTQARGGANSREAGHPDFSHVNRSQWQEGVTYTITGDACACPDTSAPTRPAVVLDPFGGTGTTALVAHVLGRHGISVDLSADYCRLAQWRTTDPKQMARAARGLPAAG